MCRVDGQLAPFSWKRQYFARAFFGFFSLRVTSNESHTKNRWIDAYLNIHPYATRVKQRQFATLSIFLISNFKRKHQNSWVLIEKRKTLSKSHSSRLVNIHFGRASVCGGGAEVERRCQIGNVCLEMRRLGWMGHFSQFSISLIPPGTRWMVKITCRQILKECQWWETDAVGVESFVVEGTCCGGAVILSLDIRSQQTEMLSCKCSREPLRNATTTIAMECVASRCDLLVSCGMLD